MRPPFPSFEPLVHETAPSLADYISEEDVAATKTILERVLNRRVADTEQTDYDSETSGFTRFVEARRSDASHKTPLNDATENTWYQHMGTDRVDLQLLLEISKRFTSEFNQKNKVRLTPDEGRTLFLKLAMAHRIDSQAESDGKRRRMEINKWLVSDYIERNSLVYPATNFESRLDDLSRASWEALPTNSGYISSSHPERVLIQYKTPRGDYGALRINPDSEPLIVNGRVIQDRDLILESVKSYGGLNLRVYQEYMNGVTIDSCGDMKLLFSNIRRALEQPSQREI